MASTEAGSTSQSVHDTESASSVALSSNESSHESSENEEENDGVKRITPKWLLNFFSKDWKHYYRTFELNEKLYLHFKGKQALELLGNFPDFSRRPFEFRPQRNQVHGTFPQAQSLVLRRQRSVQDQWAGHERRAAMSLPA